MTDLTPERDRLAAQLERVNRDIACHERSTNV